MRYLTFWLNGLAVGCTGAFLLDALMRQVWWAVAVQGVLLIVNLFNALKLFNE